MAFEFGNILGLLGLVSLIPLIILYLIKPRPSTLKVPSLMFFFNRERTTTFESFLRHFHDDLLFYLQLFVLLLLGFSLAQPLLSFERKAVSNNIVFVLDVSASSQVIEKDGRTRLDIAKDTIKDLVTSKNSLILIKSKPVIALQNVGRSELIRYLDGVHSTDDLSDISSAIVVSAELLEENKGRIVVLSDFGISRGVPISVSESIAKAKGIYVDLINTALSRRKNIGIVDLALSDDSANVYIKNFNDNDENVKLKIGNNIKEFSIKSGSVEPYVFKLENGDTKIVLNVKDDFDTDNNLIITRPYEDKLKVLLISKNPSKFIKAALNSISYIDLTTAQLPVIPKGKFDVVVVSNINNNDLLQGSFNDLKNDVVGGTNLIFASWDGIDEVDFSGLLPLNFNGKATGGQINIDQATKFTNDLDFGDSGINYKVEGSGFNILSVNNNPVLSLFNFGKGKVLYYGLMDDADFRLSPDYPIFWSNIISYLAGREDLNEINLKTGEIFDISNETAINLDKKGIFNLGDKKYSVNLLDEKESDINNEFGDKQTISATNVKLPAVKVYVDYRIDFLLVFIAFCLVLFEFFYIKYRGEI